MSLGCVLAGGERFDLASFEGRWSREREGLDPYVRGRFVPSVLESDRESRDVFIEENYGIFIHV